MASETTCVHPNPPDSSGCGEPVRETTRPVSEGPLVAPTASANGHSLLIDTITHHFGRFCALDNVTLDIGGGELIALLGPSGCGKTTLLKLIAGFIRPQRGSINIDGRMVNNIDASRRGVGIVFQNYALFPHMSIRENIAYGLRARRVPRTQILQRVREMLRLIKLEGIENRYPLELSGGQQQRVALARALVVQPHILLLDEPFGALDKGLRLDMQMEIRRIQRQLGITTVLVTHDQEEALSMADRVAVINHGRVEQFDDPTVIYDQPATRFVSSFVGTTNLIPAHIVAREADGRVRLRLRNSTPLICRSASNQVLQPGSEVLLAIRPERIRIDTENNTENTIQGRVMMSMSLGPSTVYEIELEEGSTIKVTALRMPETPIMKINKKIRLILSRDEKYPILT